MATWQKSPENWRLKAAKYVIGSLSGFSTFDILDTFLPKKDKNEVGLVRR